jgi:cytochrome oxidase assembly protein ShyY1
MPLPLVPIAVYAASAGTVALATWKLARKIERGRRDQRAEDALDEVDEGVTVRREAEQANGTARFRRVIRFGEAGTAIEIDAAVLGRITIKKV